MRAPIRRDPLAFSQQSFDLIVVGGGIYGACLALESARRGLRPLLLERDDFGGATSGNSLRILHGGLRYLQNLDLPRFRQSVRERRWFLTNFPDLVQPLPCLMPLYGEGLRRPTVMRFALGLNDLLSRQRNNGVIAQRHLVGSSVISAAETVKRFPTINTVGLRGGAYWTDAWMQNPPRLLTEILRWACGMGAKALNYVEATGLQTEHRRVCGVEAADRESGNQLRFEAPVIVNCAGPWCRDLAQTFDHQRDDLFQPSMAFNILLDRPSLSTHAIAVSPKRSGAGTYFLVPYKRRILVGTSHLNGPIHAVHPHPSAEQLRDLINDLNDAIPQLQADTQHVVRVYAGLLPAVSAGSHRQATRPIVLDHGLQGGPEGLFSVSGVKYTTARAVAQRTLDRLGRFTKAQKQPEPARESVDHHIDLTDFAAPSDAEQEPYSRHLRQICQDEAVVHLDDLIFRRTDWSGEASRILQIGEKVCPLLHWDAERQKAELNRLTHTLRSAGIVVDQESMKVTHVH